MKAFISIFIFITTLFAIVFMQMEERRMGYMALKVRKEHKRINEELRFKEIQLARVTRPQLLEQVAKNKLDLQRTDSDQIIYLSDKIKFDFTKMKRNM